MIFNDLFEQDNKRHKHGHDQYYGNDFLFHHSHTNNHHSDFKQVILQKLQNNPKFKSLLIFAAIILIAVVITITILLFPLLVKLVNFISENGIQGIINAIWKGNK